MKECPGGLTWQAVIDGEEDPAQYMEHLEDCPACQKLYREIREAVVLAGCLRCEAKPRAGFAAAVLAGGGRAPALSLPAGLVALLLFALALAAALLLDPGYWTWWLSVGITRSCSLLMDILFGIIYFGQGLNPAWLLGPALLLVLLELVLLRNIKTVGEC